MTANTPVKAKGTACMAVNVGNAHLVSLSLEELFSMSKGGAWLISWYAYLASPVKNLLIREIEYVIPCSAVSSTVYKLL